MTGLGLRAPGGAYEGAGRQAALAVRGYSSVIVASDDVAAAAHAAIGIALAESAHRLVMIADLAGETAPIQALINDDDSHGVYDAFEFGTSFVRVAREVEGTKNFFVMPSGTESAAVERIIGSPRWGTFASEFANADELLLLVTSASAPGLASLSTQVDGVILVGVAKLNGVPAANILSKIPHPTIVAPPRIDIAPKREPWSIQKIGLAAAALLAIGIAGGALLAPSAESDEPVAIAAGPDSAIVDSTSPQATALMPANPADSLDATPFSVEILLSNTAEAAEFFIKGKGSSMPGATISLVPIGDTEATWYKVFAGAYTDSSEADRLLASLRRRKVIEANAGSIIRAPLALMIDSVSPQAGMSARIREKLEPLATKGVIAYALIQRDGGARIFAGAFDTPQQTSLAATALRVAGLTPVLVYRTGRLQ